MVELNPDKRSNWLEHTFGRFKRKGEILLWKPTQILKRTHLKSPAVGGSLFEFEVANGRPGCQSFVLCSFNFRTMFTVKPWHDKNSAYQFDHV